MRKLALASNHSLVLTLLLVGSGIFNLSEYSLTTANPFPLTILLLGVLLIAASVTMFAIHLLGDPGSTRPSSFYILYVVVLSIALSLTRLSRFAGYSGADIVKEGQVSLGTYSANYWQPSLGELTNYQSSLAVTILPSIIGRIVGVTSRDILLPQSFVMMALLPIAVQAIASNITGSPRLGALSGVLIATNWFFFGAHLIGKTEVALFLLTLSVYCFTRKENSLRSLGVLLGAGVVMSHYTIGIYYSAVLLIILTWSKILGRFFKHLPGFTKLTVPPFHTWRPVLTIGLVVLWLAYAAPLVLPTLQTATVQALSGLISGTGQKRADTSGFLSNPGGLPVTLWFDFQNGLLALGALLAVNYYRKGRIVGSLAIWTVAGVSLVVLPVIWILIPGLSVQVESTRTIEMILPFSILLVARLFMRVYSFPGLFWKALVILVIFLLVPMNLMLFNSQEVLYNQPDKLSLDRTLDLDSSYLPYPSNYAMSYWADGYLSTNNTIESDAISHYALYVSLPFPSKINPIQEDFSPVNHNRYAVLSYYFIDYNNWTKSSLGTISKAPGDPSLFFQFPLYRPTRDTVYSSPRFWIVSPPHNSTG